MSAQKRFSADAMVVAGLSLALWVAVHPWDQLAGADVGRSGQWIASHSFHFFAGLFSLLGLLWFVPPEWTRARRLGPAAFLVAFVGSALFTGTGMFTAWIWPLLAVYAPFLTETAGPIFSPPHPLIGVTAILFSGGWALLALALVRERSVPALGPWLAIAGAALLMVPPSPAGPMPWPGFVAAGVLQGAGMAWIGAALRARSPLAPGPSPSSLPA